MLSITHTRINPTNCVDISLRMTTQVQPLDGSEDLFINTSTNFNI